MMNKNEFIAKYAEKYETKTGEKMKKSEAEMLVDLFLDTQLEAVKGGGVNFYMHYAIEKRATEARTARNPKTGEEVQVEAGFKAAFKRHKLYKEI